MLRRNDKMPRGRLPQDFSEETIGFIDRAQLMHTDEARDRARRPLTELGLHQPARFAPALAVALRLSGLGAEVDSLEVGR